jgi:hypothetical protein
VSISSCKYLRTFSIEECTSRLCEIDLLQGDFKKEQMSFLTEERNTEKIVLFSEF